MAAEEAKTQAYFQHKA
jgi:hypothetical protein